ncbi:MAG: EamA family transporter [Actinobacteria bacterium]|nr:EamA family transporter [Actinomycetota bacterium]MSX71871.1 EamA family transporter [Actinomycetota bacterium]MSY69433.1 EamA family transporter [Actinomycetota bacterium]MTA75792.1 EamA family transporter [Actinomycetota bacterium]
MKFAPWALLTVAMAWGWSFVIMKDAIERQSVNNFLFTRFLLGTVVMVLIRPKTLKLLNKDLLLRAGTAGIFLGFGYIFQTLGLARTGAAITGFVTGLYVVLTPLFAWLFLKEKINRFTWTCIAAATVGLGLLSIHGFSVGFGELLVFISAIFYACHIISLSKWSSGRDVYAMTVVQLFMCGVLSGIASIPGGYSPPPDAGVWGVVIFTAVFATAIAFIIQTWAQAHMSSTKVAVILTMEVVFAAIFAIIFGGERLTLQSALGGILVITSMYLIVIKESK